MNIAFHYYAIKAMAARAGFLDRESQIIAEYSQFIDDFSSTDTIYTTWAPDEAVEMGLAVRQSENKYKIDLVTTGFVSLWDTVKLMSKSLRNRMLVPFHFILENKMTPENYEDVTKAAGLDDGQIVSKMMRAVREELYDNYLSDRDKLLMHLGMILHVYADTYAHQGFSGHRQDTNKYEITEVRRKYPDRQELVTDKYKNHGIIPFSTFPAIGHCMAGHVPDDTYLNFTITNNTIKDTYRRDNMECFLAVSRTIFNLLKYCNHTIVPMFELVADDLKNGFYADNDNPVLLREGWTSAFRYFNINFRYSRNDIIRRLLPDMGPYSEDKGIMEEAFNKEQYDAVLNEMFDSSRSENSPQRVYSAAATVEFFQFMIQAHAMRSAAVDDQYLP